MATVTVHADGNALRAAFASVDELGSRATKLLVGKHGDGSIARVRCSDFYPRNADESVVSHLRVMVTLPVL
jgi:hypothetical protein